MSKRALLLSALYLPNIGGVENSLTALAAELASSGYKVFLVCSNRNYVDDSTLATTETLPHLMLLRYRYNAGLSGYVSQFTNCTRLIKCVQDRFGKFDLVVSRSHITTVCARAAGIKNIEYIVPSVTMTRDWPFRTGKFGLRALSKYLIEIALEFCGFRMAARVYVFSKGMERQSRIGGLSPGMNTIRLSPGVDRKRFHNNDWSRDSLLAVKSALGIPVSGKMVLGLGRFAEQKRFDLAIRAIALMDESFFLILVGGGPEESFYEKLIGEMGLEKRVVLVPSSSVPEKYYAVANVFVMSSTYETFGQTMLEATASGVPVAAFAKSRGIKTAAEDIYRGFGMLAHFAESTEPRSLAGAIARANDAVGVRFLDEQEEFLKRYSWRAMKNKLEMLSAADDQG